MNHDAANHVVGQLVPIDAWKTLNQRSEDARLDSDFARANLDREPQPCHPLGEHCCFAAGQHGYAKAIRRDGRHHRGLHESGAGRFDGARDGLLQGW